MSKIELMEHWNNYGINEDRIFNSNIYKERNDYLNFDLIKLLKFPNKEVNDIEIIDYLENTNKNLKINNKISLWDENWHNLDYNNQSNFENVKYFYFDNKLYLFN